MVYARSVLFVPVYLAIYVFMFPRNTRDLSIEHSHRAL
jgi:hypothetical protein